MHFIKITHKWLSLIIGVQLMLWLASGLAFNLLDSGKVSGRHLAASQPDHSLMASRALLGHEAIAARYAPGTVTGIELVHRLGRPLYRVATAAGIELRDARTGSPFAVDGVLAREIATRDYTGDDQLIGTPMLMETTTLETRGHATPIWRVDVDDAFGTTLYVSAQDGQVVERRNDTWRLFDLFWMLHIMDYTERQDFNNPFVIAFGFGALLLSISGCLLLFGSFSRHDFNLMAKLRRSKVAISLHDSSANPINQLALTSGSNLFDGLAAHGINLPSNCGGGGSCGLCQVRLDPQAPVSGSERALLSSGDLAQGVRLACQQRATAATSLTLDDRVLDASAFQAEVTQSRFLTPYIKEIHLQPLGGRAFDFKAGSFVQLEIPPHRLRPRDLLVDKHYRQDWSQWHQVPQAQHTQTVQRSYSMANSPGEAGTAIVLNVRIQPPANTAHPAGAGSSYLFNLRPGDRVNLSGPYGSFNARDNTDGPAREMVFIGGGAGMAPLRSIIVDQLRNCGSRRKMSFWYGARSLREVFYRDQFDQLSAEHNNFSWQLGLSDPQAEDHWEGPCGFISDIAATQYLRHHPDIANCEFYLCGPPAMLKACKAMLSELGVGEEMIAYDDFGC